MLTKEEIEEILSNCFVVEAPMHVLVTNLPLVHSKYGRAGGATLHFFRGIQPSWRSDVVILGPEATGETLLHEAIHANFMFREVLTYPLGKILWIGNRIRRNRMLGLRMKDVKYVECSGCMLCSREGLRSLRVRVPEKGKVTHYVRIQ